MIIWASVTAYARLEGAWCLVHVTQKAVSIGFRKRVILPVGLQSTQALDVTAGLSFIILSHYFVWLT